jgi:hypothetical protein
MAEPTKKNEKGLIRVSRDGWPEASKSTLSLQDIFSGNIRNLRVGKTKMLHSLCSMEKVV